MLSRRAQFASDRAAHVGPSDRHLTSWRPSSSIHAGCVILFFALPTRPPLADRLLRSG
jgi:hypothetical protein